MAFWRLTVKYSIHDTYGESDIFLNIARNSGFKLNDCYFHNYNWDEFSTSIYITCFIDNKTSMKEREALKKGYEMIEISQNIFNFLIKDISISLKFNYENSEFVICNKKITFIDEKVIFSNSKNSIRLRNFDNTICNFTKDKLNQIIRSINYYIRSHYLFSIQMYEESFLNGFKCLELIANDNYEKKEILIKSSIKSKSEIFVREISSVYYNDKDTTDYTSIINSVTKQLVNNINIKQKLLILNKSQENYVLIKDIVLVRNKYIAHGNVGEIPEELINLTNDLISMNYHLIRDYFFEGKRHQFSLNINSKHNPNTFSIGISRKWR